MKVAIQFGAGNIGRGFIGKLLSQSGYKVYFTDINQNLINEMNSRNEYLVEVVGKKKEEILVKNVEGVISSGEEIIELIAKVDIITTAVGPTILSIISKTLAKGIRKRMEVGNTKPLNIIACENMIKSSTFLKEEIQKYIDKVAFDFMKENIGFPNSAVDRIVPPIDNEADILKVRVEEFKEWIVDKTLFKGEIPMIKGMQLTDNLIAFVERKLFTLNTGHAIAAYLGALKGYNTIKESIEDLKIKEIVRGAMKESGKVLIKRYGFKEEEHFEYIEKIISRFENPYLKDEVKRVGREPLRKLSFNDRLIKPLRGTLEYAMSNDNLIYGIAAAFRYEDLNDQQTKKLQKKISSSNLKTVIREVTLLSENQVIEKIIKKYNSI